MNRIGSSLVELKMPFHKNSQKFHKIIVDYSLNFGYTIYTGDESQRMGRSKDWVHLHGGDRPRHFLFLKGLYSIK